MFCAPGGRVAVIKLALPRIRVTVPNVEPALLNVTVPVGTPLPGAFAATVAEKVTHWPYTDGFTDDVTEVVVASLVTVSTSSFDVLGRNLELPL